MASTNILKLDLPRLQRWSLPLTVQAVIVDIDGTIMPSYNSLLAVHAAKDHLIEKGLNPATATQFVKNLARGLEFQQILHTQEPTLSSFRRFAHEYNLEADAQIIEYIKNIQEESFALYPGVRDFLHWSHSSGLFVGAYTNSPDYFVARRLDMAGVQSSKMDALWARQHNDYAPGIWEQKEGLNPNRRGFSRILIPYSYRKPSNKPLLDLANLTGIAPENILYIGEGNGDLNSVYVDREKPAAVFGFHEQGAREICAVQRDINEALRPGAEPLGLDAVNRRITELGVESDIMRYPHGFGSVMDMIDDGRIRPRPLPNKPRVRGQTLVAGSG